MLTYAIFSFVICLTVGIESWDYMSGIIKDHCHVVPN